MHVSPLGVAAGVPVPGTAQHHSVALSADFACGFAGGVLSVYREVESHNMTLRLSAPT